MTIHDDHEKTDHNTFLEWGLLLIGTSPWQLYAPQRPIYSVNWYIFTSNDDNVLHTCKWKIPETRSLDQTRELFYHYFYLFEPFHTLYFQTLQGPFLDALNFKTALSTVLTVQSVAGFNAPTICYLTASNHLILVLESFIWCGNLQASWICDTPLKDRHRKVLACFEVHSQLVPDLHIP